MAPSNSPEEEAQILRIRCIQNRSCSCYATLIGIYTSSENNQLKKMFMDILRDPFPFLNMDENDSFFYTKTDGQITTNKNPPFTKDANGTTAVHLNNTEIHPNIILLQTIVHLSKQQQEHFEISNILNDEKHLDFAMGLMAWAAKSNPHKTITFDITDEVKVALLERFEASNYNLQNIISKQEINNLLNPQSSSDLTASPPSPKNCG